MRVHTPYELGRRIESANRKLSRMAEQAGGSGEEALDVCDPLDVSSWVRRNLSIRSKRGEIVPLVPNAGQKSIFEHLDHQRACGKPIRLVILKPRQIGATTAVAAALFAYIHRSSQRTGQIVAHRLDSARKIHRITRRFLRFLPKGARRPAQAFRDYLEFPDPHGSEISVLSAQSPDLGRGETLHYAHWSEFAYWPDAPDLFDALMQAVPHPAVASDTAVIIESTANGNRNLFADLWHYAQEEDSEWHPLFLDWRFHDPTASLEATTSLERRDPQMDRYAEEFKLTAGQKRWAGYVLANQCRLTWERFHQEYPATPSVAFQFSGYPWFNVAGVERLRTTVCEPRERLMPLPGVVIGAAVADPGGDLMVWLTPEEAGSCTVGVDTSEGIGADYTVIVVLSDDPVRLAALYVNNRISPSDAGSLGVAVAEHYNKALLAVERNSSGMAALAGIAQPNADGSDWQGYPHLYFERRMAAVDGHSGSIRLGFSTTRKSKVRALLALNEAISSGDLEDCPSGLVLNQLSGIQWNPETHSWNQAYRDPVTRLAHDDCVMALAVANIARIEKVRPAYLPRAGVASW